MVWLVFTLDMPFKWLMGLLTGDCQWQNLDN